MSLSAAIPILKSQARRLKRLESIPLSEALNRIAQREGYASWSLLVARDAARKDAELFNLLDPGDLLLIGARPGHGKTACALKVMVSAMRRGAPCWFFSLDNDAPKPEAQFAALNERSSAFSRTFYFTQIHHSFEAQARPLPSAADVRLLNPLDLRLFDKSLFLHEGRLGRLQATGAGRRQ